ncbi:LAGLIDADG family homing endonuclease [Candidatus Saganbacteria bacterium]|nr:LAGLIDADG family homing endonuclease [Candidatus Saganbacteria bacterium]
MENSWYITGFTDGEGCFSVSFNFRNKLNTGIEVRPSFSISQNKKSLAVLNFVREYFDCGAIRFDHHDQTYKYEVRSIDDIIKQIVPHFDKYSLKTAKVNDFYLFREICYKVHANHHRSQKLLPEIIELAYKMNESGKRKYTEEYLLNRLAR